MAQVSAGYGAQSELQRPTMTGGGVGGPWSGGPRLEEGVGGKGCRGLRVGTRGFSRSAGPQLLPSRELGRGNQLRWYSLGFRLASPRRSLWRRQGSRRCPSLRPTGADRPAVAPLRRAPRRGGLPLSRRPASPWIRRGRGRLSGLTPTFG